MVSSVFPPPFYLMIYLGMAGAVFQSVWPSVAVKYTNKGAVIIYLAANTVVFIGYRDTLDDGWIQPVSSECGASWIWMNYLTMNFSMLSNVDHSVLHFG